MGSRSLVRELPTLTMSIKFSSLGKQGEGPGEDTLDRWPSGTEIVETSVRDELGIYIR